MRLHRFIGDFELGSGVRLSSNDSGLINQLRNVFRLTPGSEVILCNGQGEEAVAKIVSLERHEIIFNLAEVRRVLPPPRTVALYLAVLKRENFEWVVEKATECGVSRIVPILTERTIKLSLNQERLQKIAREAAEQSGRGMVPEVLAPIPFEQAVHFACESGDSVFFCDAPGEKSLLTAGDKLTKSQAVSVFIGPEGGWSEVEKAVGNKFEVVSLGEFTLRGETAAIVASYLAVHSER